jgi:hypothetical protein
MKTNIFFIDLNINQTNIMQEIKDISIYKYTKELREQLVKNICIRFGSLLNNEVFLFVTILDPHYGPLAFPLNIHEIKL